MDLVRFLREREPLWKELERRLEALDERGITALDRAGVRRLVALYRQASSDLIEAESRLGNADLLAYLNALVGRAYGELYTARGLDPRAAWHFLTRGFPALVRRSARPIVLAGAVFLGG